MDFRITSQGGQVNLSISSTIENKQVSADRDVIEVVNAKDKGYREEDITKAVDKLNEFLKDENTYAEYSVHEELGDVMIKIIDQNTKEVLMEFKPEKILDLISRMMKLVGVSIDKKA